MPIVAYVLGGRIVEKHFTLNRARRAPTTASRWSRWACASWSATCSGRGWRSATGQDRLPSETDPITKMGKKIVAAATLPAGHVISARTWR